MEGTYEYELERAELLGVEPISREKWEEQQKARREAEIEQEELETAQILEAEDEKVKSAHGKLDELNSILSATQIKINKFKSVCGSFTNLLRSRTSSPAPPTKEDHPSTSNSGSGTINEALDTLDQMKEVQQIPDVQFGKKMAVDINQKVSKNIDKLDSLISKAEHAEMSMAHQTQQMKKHLKK